MNAEFFAAIADLEKEKGISADYMLEKIRQALLAAYKKDNPDCGENVVVDIDPEKKSIAMYVQMTVVERMEDVYDAEAEFPIEEAEHYVKRPKVGDVVNVPVETKKFGRIAAQAAKQIITQSIREAERGHIYDEFTSKYTEAMLSPSERIKGEELREGDRIKVYVVEVRRSPARGPQVFISRTHPGLVKRLFELEVPEIFDGTVEIRSIAREAGSRSKIAVWSADPAVDPIGACVGPNGGRVGSIVEELGGEKIDIVKYSEDPQLFIASALSPAEVISVELLEEGRSARVVVPDSQLSLAIGKEGQNARLAAKLTGYKIDIKPASAAE